MSFKQLFLAAFVLMGVVNSDCVFGWTPDIPYQNIAMRQSMAGDGPMEEEMGGCGCGEGCSSMGCNRCGPSPCCGCENWLETTPGFFGEAQLLYLRAHDSEVFDGGSDFEMASRVTVGYNMCGGRSLRVRYFDYDTEIQNAAESLHLRFLDAEYAGRFELGPNWRGDLSGGFRAARFAESDNLIYDDSYGLVLGAAIRGSLTCNWELFGTLRQSYQFGAVDDEEGPDIRFGTFAITELQMGVIREFDLCCGKGFVQFMVETDYIAGAWQFDTQDVGLVGGGFGIGLSR